MRIFVRERPGEGPPAVFVHGNPTTRATGSPFLERCEGPAIAFDLPGFGRSGRGPAGLDFDHTLTGSRQLVEGLLDELAPERATASSPTTGERSRWSPAQRPSRAVERLVVIDAVPLSRAYRWHWIARIWRRRGSARPSTRSTRRRRPRQLLRLARPGRRPMPAEFVDAALGDLGRGMSERSSASTARPTRRRSRTPARGSGSCAVRPSSSGAKGSLPGGRRGQALRGGLPECRAARARRRRTLALDRPA